MNAVLTLPRSQTSRRTELATPEQRARQEIDRLLTQAGWSVQDMAAVNLRAARGVAIREFPLDAGQGFADYLLYVDGKACGVIEAKKLGATLTGVEIQSQEATIDLQPRPEILLLPQLDVLEFAPFVAK